MQPESNAHGGRVRQAHRHFMWVCAGSQTSTEVNEPTCFGTLDLCGLGVTGAPRGWVSPGTPVVTFSGLSAPKKKDFSCHSDFPLPNRALQKQYHKSALTSTEEVVFWKCKHPRKPRSAQRTVSLNVGQSSNDIPLVLFQLCQTAGQTPLCDKVLNTPCEQYPSLSHL